MQASPIIDHIVAWLKSYCAESGSRGFVVAVSGGIDSAVTSKLAAKTYLPTLCLEMPIHQDRAQVECAVNHINHLRSFHSNVDSLHINLTPVFKRFVKALPKVEIGLGSSRKVSLANSRARLRMTTLYYYAAINNYLVVGTGNKVEDFGVGFFTKYGDGGVDISPIADLTKSEVYRIGDALGINKEIMQAQPTDGLYKDNRTDEDQLGASYEEMEWAMSYNEEGTDHLSSRQLKVLKIYQKLHKANQHKMNPIPVCTIPDELRINGI
ncbi:MAG: NAD(+) synthase [Gammaproteobacteria bacterium]|nr:NAD(+) synthase [Gammaproteobacteria bacterium]MCY4218505.1 NAD(+) synthase [Gammaproteobacteria bacterium]MCY4276153.1 NAD(+) synthase [Gammaproteobacteria bacterium]